MALPMQQASAKGESEEVLCMVLTQKDGTVCKFALRDAPVVTYEGDNLVVKCGQESLTTALSGISTFTFENDIIEGISTAKEGKANATFSFGQATFNGLKANAAVRVYSLDGQMVSSTQADANGNASIDLGQQQRGVYIIRTPQQSYKIHN